MIYAMLGPLVNALAIVVAALIGLGLRKVLNQAFLDNVMQVLGIIVAVIGIKGIVVDMTLIVVIISLVLGLWIGEFLNLEQRLHMLIERKVKPKNKSTFTQGFVSASLVFVVGAMAIIGSLESGINHNHVIVFTKATLDFTAAVVMSATLGIGVLFSALVVLLYQGALTLLASSIAPYLNPTAITIISSTGSVLVVMIGLNMLRFTSFKVVNHVLSVVIALFIAQIMHIIGL